MTCPLGPGLKRRRILELDLAQPLRLELLLRQRHAPVEHLRVALDAAALEVEAPDAVEGYARALGFGPRGVEREAVAGVADVAHRNRIEELPKARDDNRGQTPSTAGSAVSEAIVCRGAPPVATWAAAWMRRCWGLSTMMLVQPRAFGTMKSLAGLSPT